jgi:tetratricopeptide (TPR) repeat protein
MPSAINASSNSYRAALALNNMAVTLIERGYYGPALKTLTESLSLAKDVFAPIRGSAEDKTSDKRLQAASVRLAKHRSSARWKVEVNTSEDDDFSALRQAANYGLSSTVFFPVRISGNCCDESDLSKVGRQFSTILYNHGLASFLASKQQSEDKTGKFFQKAYKSFQMAERTLASIMQSNDDIDEELSMVLLSAMALNGLSLIYRGQDLLFKAEEAQRIVGKMCSEVDEDCFPGALAQPLAAGAA